MNQFLTLLTIILFIQVQQDLLVELFYLTFKYVITSHSNTEVSLSDKFKALNFVSIPINLYIYLWHFNTFI